MRRGRVLRTARDRHHHEGRGAHERHHRACGDGSPRPEGVHPFLRQYCASPTSTQISRFRSDSPLPSASVRPRVHHCSRYTTPTSRPGTPRRGIRCPWCGAEVKNSETLGVLDTSDRTTIVAADEFDHDHRSISPVYDERSDDGLCYVHEGYGNPVALPTGWTERGRPDDRSELGGPKRPTRIPNAVTPHNHRPKGPTTTYRSGVTQPTPPSRDILRVRRY